MVWLQSQSHSRNAYAQPDSCSLTLTLPAPQVQRPQRLAPVQAQGVRGGKGTWGEEGRLGPRAHLHPPCWASRVGRQAGWLSWRRMPWLGVHVRGWRAHSECGAPPQTSNPMHAPRRQRAPAVCGHGSGGRVGRGGADPRAGKACVGRWVLHCWGTFQHVGGQHSGGSLALQWWARGAGARGGQWGWGGGGGCVRVCPRVCERGHPTPTHRASSPGTALE